jgi:hypothetical protein
MSVNNQTAIIEDVEDEVKVENEEDFDFSGVERRNNYQGGNNEGVDTKLFEWKFLESFTASVNSLFLAEAVSKPGDKHSYLALSDLRKRKNPDISRVFADL